MKPEEESEWLLDEPSTPESADTARKAARWARRCMSIYFVALHAVIGVLLTILIIDHLHRNTRGCHSAAVNQTWSPVDQHVEYQSQHEYAMDHASSPFSGPSSDEVDRAWDKLVMPSFFRVSREELEKAEASFDNITELTDGGYVATLGVYHELHCVRQLRFWLFKDHYYPNLTKTEEDYFYYHLDHCLEALRHIVMCRGNTALRSFAWVDPSKHLPTAQSNSRISCVKWDSIYAWSEARMVPYNPSLIRPSWVA